MTCLMELSVRDDIPPLFGLPVDTHIKINEFLRGLPPYRSNEIKVLDGVALFRTACRGAYRAVSDSWFRDLMWRQP